MCRKTLQITDARIISRFGWGLARAIENHGLARFKANVQRVCESCSNLDCKLKAKLQSREGIAMIVALLRQNRLQPMTMGVATRGDPEVVRKQEDATTTRTHPWRAFSSWFYPKP